MTEKCRKSNLIRFQIVTKFQVFNEHSQPISNIRRQSTRSLGTRYSNSQ